MGLAITKHIVEAHGGHISVSSPGKGHGAEFIVHLPIIKESANEVIPQVLNPNASTALVLKDLKVLLVDDSDDIRHLITRYLEKRGAQVLAVNSAFEALDILRNSQQDILVSDISMPEMDGYELISSVRKFSAEQGGNIKAMALTAYAREEEEQKSLAAGFNVHLSKPISAHDLVDNIARLLQLNN
ncbi:Sensor histidine kinase TmoS [compost metagenome]